MKPHTTPKDFFVNVGALIALIIGVSALLTLIFAVINHFVADLSPWYGLADYTVRWTVSMLIVIVPIYYVLNHIINRDIRLNPEKKEIWVWKWLTYLTLFLSGATLAGDLIAIINVFLGGELTSRFLLKAIAVLVVSALVFFYYFAALKKSTEAFAKFAKALFTTSLIVVIVFIVLGFVAAGSPFEARKARLDQERTNVLSSIESAVEMYADRNGKLPVDLMTVENEPMTYFTIQNDPLTDKPYEYRVITANKYEICAEFQTSTNEKNGAKGMYEYSYARNYEHGIGRTCFTRTVNLPTLLQ